MSDYENEDGLSPAPSTRKHMQVSDTAWGPSERTMEQLKRDVHRGYRRFWEKRGMKPPEERGWKV